MSANNLKPQDVVVALKFACRPERPWKYAPLAAELCLSQSELHASVRRLLECRLWNPVLNRVNRTALRNFLVHGLVHVFPATPASAALGMPTGISAAPLAGKLISRLTSSFVYVEKRMVHCNGQLSILPGLMPRSKNRSRCLPIRQQDR